MAFLAGAGVFVVLGIVLKTSGGAPAGVAIPLAGISALVLANLCLTIVTLVRLDHITRDKEEEPVSVVKAAASTD